MREFTLHYVMPDSWTPEVRELFEFQLEKAITVAIKKFPTEYVGPFRVDVRTTSSGAQWKKELDRQQNA